MKYTKSIKPISYLKAHASEMVRDASINGTPYIITQKGEAKAILLDLKEYQRKEDALALMKIIALAEKDIDEGRVTPIKKVFAELDKKIAKLKNEWNTK